MRCVVLGAGAVGGTVGGLLARRGRPVALIARGAHGAALRERGLRVETPRGSFAVAPPVFASPAEVAWRADDVVLLATKLQDAQAALEAVARVAPASVAVACLTNGLAGERQAAASGIARIQAVCVRLPTSFAAPGVVQAWGAPVLGALDVGRYPAGTDELTTALVEALADPELLVRPRAEVMAWKRQKLLSNLGNAVEALCGADAPPEVLAAAHAEGVAVFTAAGLAWASEDEFGAGAGLGQIDGRSRAGGSTWQSLARGGGRTEVDYLSGEIVALGARHGVATPVNAALQRLVNAAARAGTGPGSMSAAELLSAIRSVAGTR